MFLRNRFLGGVSPLVCFNAEGGGGAAPPAPAAAAAAAPAAAAPAPAAAVAEPAAPATLANKEPGAAAPAAAAAAPAVQPGFGDKWREQLAGEDKDALKDLGKYTDPNALYKSLRDLQSKISKGELKAPPAPLAENATEEQKTEWRKANGLPDSVDAMVKGIELPKGVVIGEADKPLIDGYVKSMFDGGATQAEVNRAIGWYYATLDKQGGDRVKADGDNLSSAQAELEKEWGPDFNANMNAKSAFLDSMPKELKALALSARMPDGTLLGNSAAFNRWAATQGREFMPASTIVMPTGGDAHKTIAAEIQTIESKMYMPDGKENPEYWKGAGGEAMQARYRELVGARDKMSKQGK